MSQSPSQAEIVAAFQGLLLDNYIAYAMTALAAYEYTITMKQEMTMVWQHRWTLVAWIFMANRYVMIGIVIWTVAPETAKSCSPALVIGDILYMVQTGIFSVFSALRIFAISGCKLPMAILVLVLNLVPVGVDIYTYSRETNIFLVDPILGAVCTANINISANVIFGFAVGTRLAVVVADILVIAFTWYKTFQNRMVGLRVGMRTPLSSLLLRDGSVYFIALLTMNIAQIIVKTIPSQQNLAPISTIIVVLEPVLISRFLLNLRKVGESQRDSQNAVASHFSAPAFRAPTLSSIVGNMGEELEHGPTNEAEVVTDSAEGDEAERADSIIELSNMTVLGNIGDSEVREVPHKFVSTQSVGLYTPR